MEEEPVLWNLCCFGGLRALRGKETIEHFRSQKIGFLLAYLALSPQRLHTREELCDLLWPEADIEAARVNLRTALSHLRKLFGDELIFTQGNVHLHLNAERLTTDVARFETKLKQAKTQQSIALYREALTLYTGPFLPACYESWALAERDRLQGRYLTGNYQLSRLLDAEGRMDEALQIARQALSADPLRDESHGEVIRLLLRSGEVALAQKHYDDFAKLLDEQLGLEPSQEVQRQLKETEPAPPRKEPVPPPAPTPTPVLITLPTPLTRFFGRESEIAQIGEALCEENRLLTITGPGGSGKTRLAIEVARSIEAKFLKRAHFVALADVREGESLPEVVLRALGQSPGTSSLEQLSGTLTGRRLLVLDNAEHLSEATARLVHELLLRLPELTVLVTSRVLLLCDGENEFPLAPLPPEDSVALFVNRVRTLRPDFRQGEANQEAISALCIRLEGIPLALELAASRAQMLTPAQILERLDHRLDFLVSRRRDTAERHQTLRAAIDWSFKMLDPALQSFFTSLSVFRGGWSLEAAETVCEEPLALDYLTHLRECSLVIVESESTEETMRYRLLETLREYAQEKLSPERRQELVYRHQTFFLEGIRAIESAPGLTQRQRVLWVERDYDNLRAALDRCAQEAERVPVGLEICFLLWRFWGTHGYYTEGRKYLDRLLAKSVEAPVLLRTQGLILRGSMASAQSDYAHAFPDLEEALRLAREIGDKVCIGHALNDLANIYRYQGDYAQARDYLEEVLRLRREIGNVRGVAGILNNLANIYFDLGELERSSEHYREALAINRELGNLQWMAVNLNNLGRNRQSAGDYSVARRYYEEALRLHRTLQHSTGIAESLANLGSLLLEQNDPEQAHPLFREALQRSREIGRRSDLATYLQSYGYCAVLQNEPAVGVQFLAAAERLLTELGVVQRSLLRAERERYLARAKKELSGADFEVAWNEGLLLSQEEATALALPTP